MLIVGGGVIGLAIAYELNRRFPEMKITILEKEKVVGEHASGRNSGVLHAGFYYSKGSLKAKLTVNGNRLLREYCLDRGVALNDCGKVVVTKNENELEMLHELKSRGDKNGVDLTLIDEKELAEIEPNAKTYRQALWSPTTSSVMPLDVVNQLAKDLSQKKSVEILCGQKFLTRVSASKIKTSKGEIEFKHLVNSAGLYADKVAHQFGVGLNYRLIPFKGLYMEYADSTLIKRHIYPVPNPLNPFLGVHFTVTGRGKIKIGPTAIPAIWRENYKGFSNFSLPELCEVLSTQAQLFFSSDSLFRNTAIDEIKKYGRAYFTSLASTLVKEIDNSKYGDFLKPGIRAQLVDMNSKKLDMDFVVEEGEKSTHILNAVSPAFTCSFSFSKLIVDKMKNSGLI